MLCERKIDLLCEAWKAVFGVYPHIERGDNPIDDEKGPEVCVDGFLSIWCQEVVEEVQSIVGTRKVTHPNGFVTGIISVQRNYPHSPDDVDIGWEKEHISFDAALTRLVREAAAARLDGFLDTFEVAPPLAEQLASEERV